MKNYYAGIGARKTPQDVLKSMTSFATLAEQKGITLRSGGAKGADSAFELGVKNANNKDIFTTNSAYVDWEKAFITVNTFHPTPGKLSSYVRLLMARNAFQVLGPNLDEPSAFVLCWTEDGATENTTRKTGGTGQAIRIANAYSVPIINMGSPTGLEQMWELVTELKNK